MKLTRDQEKIVRAAVDRQVERSPGARDLAADRRVKLRDGMTKIGVALAEDEVDLVDSVDFPDFVRGLISGVFSATVDASIQQMESYAELIASVSASVDEVGGEPLKLRRPHDLKGLPRPRGPAIRGRLRPRRIDLRLPDLEGADPEVIADNIRAVGVIYSAAELEAMKLFLVVDKLVELWVEGQLPIGQSQDADRLMAAYRAREDLREAERKERYLAALGGALGDRFRAFVVAIARAAPSGPPPPPTPALLAAVADAGAAVIEAVPVGGLLRFYAVELDAKSRRAMAIVGGPTIQAAFGARDPWTLVEVVSRGYLGGAVASVPTRARATAARTLLFWLAGHLDAVHAPASLDLAPIADPARSWLATAVDGDAWPS